MCIRDRFKVAPIVASTAFVTGRLRMTLMGVCRSPCGIKACNFSCNMPKRSALVQNCRTCGLLIFNHRMHSRSVGTSSARISHHDPSLRSNMKARVPEICCVFRLQKFVSPRLQAYVVLPASCPASFKQLSNLHRDNLETAACVRNV